MHDPAELHGVISSLEDAFRVQLGLLGCHERAGDRQVGRKVGLTAKAIQAQPGFYEPVIGPGVTFEQARSAISRVAPALEIIEKRHVARPDMRPALADNGQQKAFVTGAEVPLGALDLAPLTVDVTVNGVARERARGAEVLGTGPIASIAWFANKPAQFGRHLEAGTRVMSGSFTKQYDIDPGDVVAARFERVGVVSASFR